MRWLGDSWAVGAGVLLALGCGEGPRTPSDDGSGGAGASGGGLNGGSGSLGGGVASGGTESPAGGAPSGGAGPVGGAPAAGGAPSEPVGGTGGTATGGASGLGDFVIEVELASELEPSAPTTVGVVTWSLAGNEPSSAHIEFGLTTEYGQVAPVDLKEEDFRTLLLGMKPAKTYHFRVVADVDGETFVSEDQTLTTGAATTAVSISKYSVLAEEQREPGFVVSSYWQGQQAGMVFILDQDGEIVWWHDSGMSGGVAKAAISMDGKDMWMISASNMGEPVRRVSLDTLDGETYSEAVGSHDIQPVQGDKVIFLEYGENDCDSVFELDKAGALKEVLELEDYMPRGACHANAVGYSKSKDVYVVSSLDADVFFFPRAGVSADNLGRLTSIAGPITTWGGIQHGVQLLNDNHMLIFANKEGGAMGPSVAIEYSLDSGEETWRYEGGQYTANLGDVQRLPGGNTLVTYSNAGIIYEVTPAGDKVLEVVGQKNLGYATWRSSLYGESEDALE